jgi:hypothetical protein
MLDSGFFRSLHAETQAAFQKVFDKIDAMEDRRHAHELDDQAQFGAIKQEMAVTKAVAESAAGPGKAGWAGIIISSITAAGSAIVAWLTGGGKT